MKIAACVWILICAVSSSLLPTFHFPLSTVFASEVVRDEKWHENRRKWQQLPPERREQLKQKYTELQKMTPEERKRFFENAERFRNLSDGQKKRLQQKFELLKSLTPQERMTVVRFVKRFNQLPPGPRHMLQRRVRRLQLLPPQHREKLLLRSPFWRRLNDSQRDAIRKFLFTEDRDDRAAINQ